VTTYDNGCEKKVATSLFFPGIQEGYTNETVTFCAGIELFAVHIDKRALNHL
jgi:hypothetical protein